MEDQKLLTDLGGVEVEVLAADAAGKRVAYWESSGQGILEGIFQESKGQPQALTRLARAARGATLEGTGQQANLPELGT